MLKTKPCPCCGNELELPIQYFNALKKMNENVNNWTPVLERDYKLRIIKKLKELYPEYLRELDDNFWNLV